MIMRAKTFLRAAIALVLLLSVVQVGHTALIWADNVRETSVTTGTGNMTLAGAVTGYSTFASRMSNNDLCWYSIRNRDVPSEWEVGIGTFVSATPALSRTLVTASSNSDAAVSFSAGVKDVWLTMASYAVMRLPAYMEVRNFSTADQSITASTPTVLTGSLLSVTNNGFTGGALAVGTRVIWKVAITKTAAGTSTSSIAVQWGTAGTTADADLLTFDIGGAGTAAADTAFLEIMVTVRGPLGASCIAVGTYSMTHNAVVTGFSVQATPVVNVVSGTFTSSTASSFFSLVLTTGASQVWTVKQVLTEAKWL